MTAAKKFTIFSSVTFLSLLGLILSINMLLDANKKEKQALEYQFSSYLLADEHRQNSDDLTNYIRAYAATGKKRFVDIYYGILDIQSGKKPRPKDYDRPYWDFVAASGEKPRQDSTLKKPLLERMKEAGFTKKELDTLTKSNNLSSGLVKIETEAMKIIENTSPDKYDYEQQMAKARTLLNNANYYQEKAKILEVLNQFYDLLEKRVISNLEDINNTRTMWKNITIAMLIFLALALVGFAVLFLTILKNLGEDPGYLYTASNEIAGGNLNFAFRGGARKKGIYAVFCEMVSNMKEKILEAETKTKEAAEQSEKAAVAAEKARQAAKEAENAKKEGMHAAANDLSEIVERVSSASEELSAQVVETNDGANQQSAMSADAATAMEEMNSTVLEVARNSSSAAENADLARAEADSGKKVVDELINDIKIVHTNTEKMKNQISGLGERAENISQILNVISDIADQTNLLALNAAIEAARAGEYGRGFAVVADEVRKLAEKTMDATKDVAEAINDIQNETQGSIRAMEVTGQAVEQTNSLADEAGNALNSILELVSNTADQIRNIATASEEQSAASEEISTSIHNIHDISSQTAEGMEQANAAIAELAQMLSNLKNLITEMKEA